MKKKKTYNVISLGMGTQSSAMYVMANRGELGFDVDLAVFADTQNEPAEVYKYKELLSSMYGDKIPIIVPTKGNLAKTTLEMMDQGKRFPFPPLWMRRISKKTGKPEVILIKQRQCTVEFKIEIVRKSIREYFGASQRGRCMFNVNMLLGITTDEATRMKDSPLAYIDHQYPLIDLDMTRDDCIDYLNDKGLPPPPKSACYQCGFKSNMLWKHLKSTDPEAFEKACVFDEKLRTTEHQGIRSLKGPVFLHSSGRPLRGIVFNDDKISGFDFACDSLHCGV